MSFAEIIECIGQMDFGCATFLLYSGITAASTVLFYVVDTPWRNMREAEDICQKAMYTAKYLKRLNSIKAKEAKEKKAIDDLEKKKLETIRIAKYIDKQKRSIKDAISRAKIQRRLLKEITDGAQASFSRDDVTAIEQQISAELLANIKTIIYDTYQMNKIRDGMADEKRNNVKLYRIVNKTSRPGRPGENQPKLAAQ